MKSIYAQRAFALLIPMLILAGCSPYDSTDDDKAAAAGAVRQDSAGD